MKHNQTIRSARVLTVLLGISLAAEGVLNLITVLTAVPEPKRSSRKSSTVIEKCFPQEGDFVYEEKES